MVSMRTQGTSFRLDVLTPRQARVSLSQSLLFNSHPHLIEYSITDIVWDAKFVDCWYVNKKGRYVLDYGKIDDFKPVGRMGGGGIDDDNEDEEDTEV